MTARLTRRPGGPARLRALLETGQTIVAPGAFDPLAARLVEEAGFPAVYMTGFGASAALLGRPDVGLLTMTEMAGNAARIAACVDIPLIADADTGYGNPINVIRTVGAYEAAGAAGIHIEDQVAPKKCGHMDGKLVIPAEEMAAKIQAATEARADPDFVIIARTDARAVEGFEQALARARRYLRAGADVLFIEALTSETEIAQAAERLPRRAAAFQLGRGRQDPAGQPGPPAGAWLPDRHLPDQHAARGDRRDAADTPGDLAGRHPRRRARPTCPASASSSTSSACPRSARPSGATPPRKPRPRQSTPAARRERNPPCAVSGPGA